MSAIGVDDRPREMWVDNVRVVLIAAVIVGHTATGYVVDIAGWFYDNERNASGVWSTFVTYLVVPGALFGLGPLFLIGGWFSARSLAHRTPAEFARSRFLRLGVPLAIFVIVEEPLANYLGNLWQEKRSIVSYLRNAEVAQLWFVAALLVFSLVYAAVHRFRPTAASPQSLRPRTVVVAVLAIAASSFAVWQVWPLTSERYFLQLRVDEWPQGAVLFGLGVHAAHAGWLERLPRPMVRRLGWMALAGGIVLPTMFVLGLGPVKDDRLTTTVDVPTLVLALLDGVIAVSGTLWFIFWLRRRWPTHGALVAKAGRAAYATYFIHPLALTLLMMLFSSVALVPGLKFVLVSVVAVPTCFAVGYALTRLPGVDKVL